MPLKRILLTVHHYPPRRVGGAELLVYRLAHRLSQQGIEVRVVCIENLSRGPETKIEYADELDGPIQVRRIDLTIAVGTDLALWHNSPLLCTQLDELLTAWRPQLVHAMGGYLMGTAPLYAARNHDLPTVVTLPDFWFLCPTIQLLRGDGSLCAGPQEIECARCLYDERRILRTIDQHAPDLMRAFWHTAQGNPWLGAPFGLPQRLDELKTRRETLIPALNASSAIVAPTHFLADLYIANGVNPEKIRIKPYALDATNPGPTQTGRENGKEIRFGFIGQVAPIKGVHLLLQAFLKAKQASATPMRLDIYGKVNASSSYMNELKRLAAESPDITMHGEYTQSDTMKLLDDLDVVVVPSLWYENSPLVILEAFRAKRPVIGTRVGGIAEVVHDDVNGLLFERGNADDLARVLLRVVDEPEMISRLAANIPPPRTAEEDMRDMMAIYDQVLASNP